MCPHRLPELYPAAQDIPGDSGWGQSDRTWSLLPSSPFLTDEAQGHLWRLGGAWAGAGRAGGWYALYRWGRTPGRPGQRQQLCPLASWHCSPNTPASHCLSRARAPWASGSGEAGQPRQSQNQAVLNPHHAWRLPLSPSGGREPLSATKPAIRVGSLLRGIRSGQFLGPREAESL